MQLVKQHDNLRSFPNAASITTGVRLDKILAVPVILLAFTAESLSAQVRCSKDQYLKNASQLSRSSDRKLQTNNSRSRSITICFKTEKHEAFHSLTVAVFHKSGL